MTPRVGQIWEYTYGHPVDRIASYKITGTDGADFILQLIDDCGNFIDLEMEWMIDLTEFDIRKDHLKLAKPKKTKLGKILYK